MQLRHSHRIFSPVFWDNWHHVDIVAVACWRPNQSRRVLLVKCLRCSTLADEIRPPRGPAPTSCHPSPAVSGPLLSLAGNESFSSAPFSAVPKTLWWRKWAKVDWVFRQPVDFCSGEAEIEWWTMSVSQRWILISFPSQLKWISFAFSRRAAYKFTSSSILYNVLKSHRECRLIILIQEFFGEQK